LCEPLRRLLLLLLMMMKMIVYGTVAEIVTLRV
jgi:hypothetical protein